MRLLLSAISVLTLAACSGGNLSQPRQAVSYATPSVARPYHDPQAQPGDVPAVWLAPVGDMRGTIVRLRDPRVERDFPDYDNAPWLAGRRSANAPDGTF